MYLRNHVLRIRGRHHARPLPGIERPLPEDDPAGFGDVAVRELDTLLADYGDGADAAGVGNGHSVHDPLLPAVNEEDARSRHHDDEDDRRHANDLADTFMLRGGKSPLLTAAQELVLARRIEKGDEVAREELVNANIRLVASVARRYLGRGLPLEDLMQEGIIGLLRAIDKYNYRRGYRFSTYATHWIRQSVSRALANQGRSIRLPAHVVDTLSRITRMREELFHKLGRMPNRPELAEAAGITEKKLIQLLKSAAHPLSLESPVGPEGEARLGDFIQADEESTPAERTFKFLVVEELEHALNTLNPREKEVLQLRYGLNNEDPHTLEETGRRMHITRERARQIEAKAMEKLRRPHVTTRLAEAMA